MATIRYEVVYKNLIRSLRRFFNKDFKEIAQGAPSRSFKDQTEAAVKAYCQQRFGAQIKTTGVELDELSFTLASLIFPKNMLSQYTAHKECLRIVTVYNYLYKFSLDRMQQLLNDLPMMLIFCKYLELSAIEPSTRSNVNLFAYLEASVLMLKHSDLLPVLTKAFNLKELFS